MTRKIAVTNQKGGVGKTTSAVSLAAALAEKGDKVLLIDMDPQANATVALGVDKREVESGVMEVMMGEATAESAAQYCEEAGLWLLPANEDLTASDEQLLEKQHRHALLKHALGEWVKQFDWVFLDCPPTLNVLTVNALVASDYVLVPIQCEYFALEGVSGLLDTVGKIRQTVNPELRIAGFIRTMYDPRSRLTREVSDNLFTYLKGLVFEGVVPRTVRLAEAPSYGQAIIQYDNRSKGADAYRDIAAELVKRIG